MTRDIAARPVHHYRDDDPMKSIMESKAPPQAGRLAVAAAVAAASLTILIAIDRAGGDVDPGALHETPTSPPAEMSEEPALTTGVSDGLD